MRSAVALVLVAACFSPSPPSNVPCAPGGGPEPRCPAGQICVMQGGVEVCLPPDQVRLNDASIDVMIDAPEIDGSPFIDTDMDMVMDDVDNCRLKPNREQYNEDGDAYGDVCDPC